MVVTLDDTKRSAIARELADMKALADCYYLPWAVSERLAIASMTLLKDDQEDLKVIEEVSAKFGSGSPQARDTIQ